MKEQCALVTCMHKIMKMCKICIDRGGGRVVRWSWVNFQVRGVLQFGGRSGGAKVLGKLSVPGRPSSLDDSTARAYFACSRCG